MNFLQGQIGRECLPERVGVYKKQGLEQWDDFAVLVPRMMQTPPVPWAKSHSSLTFYTDPWTAMTAIPYDYLLVWNILMFTLKIHVLSRVTQ